MLPLIAALCLICCFPIMSFGAGPAARADITAGAENVPYDEIAHLLAGMRFPETGGAYSRAKKSAWKKYAAGADRRWDAFNKNKAAAIRKWSSRALADIRNSGRTVLYPFGGPDFIYAYTFLPDAAVYVLLGLEPTGRLPNLADMSNDEFSACFQLLDEALKDILQISFFKTNDMSEELSGECITGTLPVMMLFLARSGSYISSLRLFDLDRNGKQIYRLSPAECRGKNGFCRGIEIEFIRAGSSVRKRLVYLSADISDSGFSQCPGCKAYLEKLEGPVISFVKSASYLMHKSYFSGIRDLLLEKSAFILQDDSAIPYRCFNTAIWDITLYGTYAGPIDMFKEHFEDDLATAYRRKCEKLNFRFGYARSSNLLLARKAPYPQHDDIK
jgi:hypothetical protein